MSELQFCKQFLAALDARPVKLSSDHISDARQYPAQSAYTLPRLPHPPHPARPNPKPSPDVAASQTADTGSINVTLTPMKPSSPVVPLSRINSATTSIFDLKQSYSTSTGIPVNKIKILWKKKPATDSKTVAEIVGPDARSSIEFTVMVLGGAAAATPATSPPAVAPSEAEKSLGGGVPVAQGPSGKDVAVTTEFWDDLKSFLVQRLRDENEGARLATVFKGAWEKDR